MPPKSKYWKDFKKEYAGENHWVQTLCRKENLHRKIRIFPLQPNSQEDADEFWQALNFPELLTNGIEDATFDPDLPPLQFDLAPLIRKHRGELNEAN